MPDSRLGNKKFRIKTQKFQKPSLISASGNTIIERSKRNSGRVLLILGAGGDERGLPFGQFHGKYAGGQTGEHTQHE